ncbi:hypothetical protein IFM51744_08216 [Aspergillus udagawae]|nr:hypothetical protein IFM51744_08216 [Aspergillus udagawae]
MDEATNKVSGSRPNVSKTCDECKSRKVRCVKTPDSDGLACNYCHKRGLTCHFSFKKRRARQVVQLEGQLGSPSHRYDPTQVAVRRPVSAAVNDDHSPYCPTDREASTSTAHSIRSQAQQQQLDFRPAKLYVDYLLEDRRTAARCRSENSFVKAHNQYVGSSGIAFFSDRRIASISERLGHRKFVDLIDKLANTINMRMNRTSPPSSAPLKYFTPAAPVQLSVEAKKLYVAAYFQHIHPIYPFIDRREFEYNAYNTQLGEILRTNVPFSALYHTVLALGCQYHRGGSFEPGSGTSWELYQVALGLFPEILVPREALLNIQAVTAMAIFAHSSCGVQISHMLTTEAARMAQSSSLSRAVCDTENVAAYQRTFWVTYILEKTLSFACGRPSVLVDADIGTPVPYAPEAIFGTFDWFLAMCRFSRLLSNACVSLFSISTTLVPASALHAAIDAYLLELEGWRESVPEEFRPGNFFPPSKMSDDTYISMALRLSYHYYSAVIALSRLRLNLPPANFYQQVTESKNALLAACSRIIELTRYIDLESYTPIWVMLSVPMSASFILFDFIVHNPTHPDTKRNLPLLSIAAGYFCHLEYASGGTLPTSLLSGMASIARDFIRDTEYGSADGTTGSESLDDILRQPMTISPQLRDPLLGLGGPCQSDDTFAANPGLENLSDPVDNLDLSSLDRLSGGVDFMDLFAGGFADNMQYYSQHDPA